MKGPATTLARSLLRELHTGAPPNVALMHLLLEAKSERSVDKMIELALRTGEARDDPSTIKRLHEVAELWRQNPRAWAIVRAIGTGHGRRHGSPRSALDYWSASYDELARTSPEASVALYSLGNPEILKAATAEIVSYLRVLELLGPGRRLLEIGCGIGRLIEALVPHVEFAAGVDISTEMVRQAKHRCARFENVRITRGSGDDLTAFASSSFDVVLVADVFPYICEAGPEFVQRTFSETARILAPGGAMVVLNFSYGGAANDRIELLRVAATAGLRVIQNGIQPFKLWDGLAFVFEITAKPNRHSIVPSARGG